LQDESRFLEQRNEFHGRHEAQLRTLPADQRLDADDTPHLQIHLGLVVQHELFLLERLA
jgi:hypothetical protein